MMLDSAFLVPIPGSTTQEREDYVRGIIEPIQAHMKQIDEERRKLIQEVDSYRGIINQSSKAKPSTEEILV